MTRRSPSLAVAMMLGILLAGVLETGEARAQFGFFYGPTPQRRAYRPRRRPPQAAAPKQVAPKSLPAKPALLKPVPPEPASVAPAPVPLVGAPEVPLPPPRPHFPGDPPLPPEVTEPVSEAGPPETPATMAPAPSGEGKEGVPATPPAPATPSEPPAERPKPELPARPESVAPPAPPKPTTKQPPVVVVPVPDELPPKGQGTRPPAKPVAGPPKEPAAPETTPTPPASEPASPSPTPGALPADPPLPPPKPPELVKPGATGVAPSGARLGETPRQPEDDATCLDRLKARNVSVEATVIVPQKDERCTVVRPVHLIGLTLADGGKVEFPEHPTIACTTADTFSTYVRDLLAPLAKGSFGSTVAAVWTGPGLECRSRDNILGAKLSAHGLGLAIDVAQLKLADGRKIEVGDPKGDIGLAFESAARAAACGYFHTVLGPGSDTYHRTHWHFDLFVRGAHGDSKYCK